MGGKYKNVNIVGAVSAVIFDSAPFEGSYNEEVHYIDNQINKVRTITLNGEIVHGLSNLKFGVRETMMGWEIGMFHPVTG